MGVSENWGYLLLESLEEGSYYLGSLFFGNAHIAGSLVNPLEGHKTILQLQPPDGT